MKIGPLQQGSCQQIKTTNKHISSRDGENSNQMRLDDASYQNKLT